MKKNLDKFLSVASFVFATLFILFLLMACWRVFDVTGNEFGHLRGENGEIQGNNGALVAVLIILAIFFFITAGWGMYLVFASNDELKEVLVYMNEDSQTKVTKGVIVKLVKKTLKDEEGIKIKGTKVLVTERGLSLFVKVKIENVDVEETFEYLKTLIADVFTKVIKLTFHEINFKVTNLKSDYEPPRDGLMTDARKKLGKEGTKKEKKAVSEETITVTEPGPRELAAEDKEVSTTKN